jgi:hypothetical protein
LARPNPATAVTAESVRMNLKPLYAKGVHIGSIALLNAAVQLL